jgi:tRNA modification GTPase
MSGQDTSYVALLTPPGMAAIAVVRIAGPRIAGFAESHLSRPPKPGRCVHCRLVDSDRVIDDPVVVLSDDLATLDINLHGGEWVVRACLDLCERFGFQRIDADQRVMNAASAIEQDMIAAIPAARTKEGLSLLLDQPRRWAMHVWNPPSISAVIDDHTLWWMVNPPRIAIVGIPNAGKSTLANQLFGQERSITADVPGTTRDYVGDFATIHGLPVMLLDTPGQRESTDAIEQAAISLSQEQIGNANLVLLVIDPTQPAGPQNELCRRHPDALIVVNKADMVIENPFPTAVLTIATRGEGMTTLRERILDHLRVNPNVQSPLFWTTSQEAMLTAATTDPQALAALRQYANPAMR